jgi:hypothetical protein
MNTIENNKLLAEFLGRNGKIRKSQYTWKGIDDLLSGGWIEVEYMKFHTDWNWLMQVVEKIESLGYKIEINKTQKFNSCFIYDVNNKTIVKTFTEIRIEAVYNACVEFVKWYNNQIS